MLRPIMPGIQNPFSYTVDASAEFQPGNIGQLTVIGVNDIVVSLSDGTAPIGILDDVRTRAHTRNQVDDLIIIPGINVTQDAYGNYINGVESKEALSHPGIIPNSFVSDYEDIVVNVNNGMVTLPVGSILNFDSNSDGQPDSVRLIANYSYQISDIPGEDSTVGSGRATIWLGRGIYETDQFDSTQHYALNCNLFVNAVGQLTSKQTTEDHPAVAMCTGPPSAIVPVLQFMWF